MAERAFNQGYQCACLNGSYTKCKYVYLYASELKRQSTVNMLTKRKAVECLEHQVKDGDYL